MDYQLLSSCVLSFAFFVGCSLFVAIAKNRKALLECEAQIKESEARMKAINSVIERLKDK